jgi:hypothetical protein
MDNKRIAEMDVMSVGQDKLAQRLALYADDAVIWDSVIQVVGYAPENTVSGPEAQKFLVFLAGLPPIDVKILSIFGEGNKVAVEWILSGGEGAGKFEIPCANLYDIENGKIKGVRMQFDSAYFAKLAGK